MATLRTVTVKLSGGDYGNIQAAIDTEIRGVDLVALDRELVIEISGGFNDTSNDAGVGYGRIRDCTTDATRCITIKTVGADRAGPAWSTSKWRWTIDSYFSVCEISNGGNRLDLTIDGLQIDQTHTGDGRRAGFDVLNLIAVVTVKNCHIRHIGDTAGNENCTGIRTIDGSGGPDGSVLKFFNNVVTGFDYGLSANSSSWGASSKQIYYNNHCVDNVITGIQWYRFSGAGSVYLKNNLCYSNGADFSDDGGGAGSFTSATNASSDATSPDTALRNRSFSFGSIGTNWALANGDTGARDQGSDLSADAQLAFSTDIVGTTRPNGVAWDVGAHELIFQPQRLYRRIVPTQRMI